MILAILFAPFSFACDDGPSGPFMSETWRQDGYSADKAEKSSQKCQQGPQPGKYRSQQGANQDQIS
ncbi:hypothetical protein FNJ84_05420 [Paracoccus sp. M683]|nr:hypothetical protein FNJ84_05420 [Paracoccus sp. M683]